VLNHIYSVCGIPAGAPTSTANWHSLMPIEPQPDICISGKYIISQQVDTCDSISISYNVSSASLFRSNKKLVNCDNIPAGLKLCLPLTCDTRVLQEGDTCTRIEGALGLQLGDIRTLNPWINKGCQNLHIASKIYGHVICVSPEGGIATWDRPGLISPVASGDYAEYPQPQPQNSTVARGTTISCGVWHSAVAGDTCTAISLMHKALLDIFVASNPSLASLSSCDAHLVPGLTYCAKPLSN
jgi:hypothetical protein